jgi:C1A family cysteine protease
VRRRRSADGDALPVRRATCDGDRHPAEPDYDPGRRRAPDPSAADLALRPVAPRWLHVVRVVRYRFVAGNPRHLQGWRRDRPNSDRDLPYTQGILRSIPASASLRSKWAPIRDQGDRGTCVLNAVLECAGYLYTRAGRADPFLSRRFLDYHTHLTEGIPPEEDSGCQIRDAVRTFRRVGSCLEVTWPYVLDEHYADPPTSGATTEALEHQAVTYYRCPSLRSIKASLAQGYAVVGGFTVFESMLTDKVTETGDIPFPAEGDPDVGGHAVAFVGYRDDDCTLQLANSWGSTWGDGGFGTLPMRYFAEGLLTDCWTLRRVEQQP